jgi:hypothetical protein
MLHLLNTRMLMVRVKHRCISIGQLCKADISWVAVVVVLNHVLLLLWLLFWLWWWLCKGVMRALYLFIYRYMTIQCFFNVAHIVRVLS